MAGNTPPPQEIADSPPDYGRIPFSWLWKQLLGLLSLLFVLVHYLGYLNFIPQLLSSLRGIRGDDELKFDLSTVYSAPLRERLVNIFTSEESKRRSLLAWIREKIPEQTVDDFNRSWCSGIALCALAEATKPGTCPRYDLLLPDQASNNCRLAMKLIRRSFGILEPFEPEDMADPKKKTEDLLVPYLRMIRYASIAPRKADVPAPKKPCTKTTEDVKEKIPDIQECLATGSGLVTAIVGRKAKVNITKPLYFNKKLVVEIDGPRGENVRRLIEDISLRRTPETLEGILSNTSQNKEKATGAIVFDCQKIKDGQYQISYIPPNPGRYKLSVLWGGEHTTNSPFMVNVLPMEGKSTSKRPAFKKSVSFSSNTDDPSSNSTSSSPAELGATRARRHSLYRQSHVSSKQGNFTSSVANNDLDSSPSLFATSYEGRISPSTTLSRTGSVLSSSTDRQGQPRVRRRVIKRVIKKPNGEDEIYYPERSSTEAHTFDRSNTSSLSMSLSVNYDDRFSSRSPSPSPVVIAPVPTLQTLERQIHLYANRCSQQILCSAFYEMSKDVVFANTKREPPSEIAEAASEENGQSTAHESTMNSSFTDGMSIQTDSIVDDVFDSSRPTSYENKQGYEEEEDQYDMNSPFSEGPNSFHRYSTALRRPRYDSETFFKPISSDSSEFPRFDGNPKIRSRSESDNLTSADSKNERELVQSHFSCFKPVTRKLENGQKENDGCNDAKEADFIQSRIRHPKLRSRRRANRHVEVEHQETQCSSSEIKRVTGWMNRRERLISVHKMKEVESKDCPASSVTTSVAEPELSTQTSTLEKNPSNKERKYPNDPVLDFRKTRAVSDPVDNVVERPHMQPRSKSFGKQSTFDSGYSDENGQNGTQYPVRTENNSENVKRVNGNLDNQIPMAGNANDIGNEFALVFQDSLQNSKRESGENVLPSQRGRPIDKNMNNVEEICSEYAKDTTRFEDSSDEKGLSNGFLPVNNDLLDKPQPFASYWEDLLYHLENDPKFPVQEFISRIKNISMDMETSNFLDEESRGVRRRGVGLSEDMLLDQLNHNESGLINDRVVDGDSHESSPLNSPSRGTKRGCCRAQGWGIQTGRVGSKNNFQVCTDGAGNGSLGVSIRGPRRHAVTECSVMYTGDELYEVFYDVSLAGFYVISVKWGDRHISDSPFIVKVSF